MIFSNLLPLSFPAKSNSLKQQIAHCGGTRYGIKLRNICKFHTAKCSCLFKVWRVFRAALPGVHSRKLFEYFALFFFFFTDPMD